MNQGLRLLSQGLEKTRKEGRKEGRNARIRCEKHMNSLLFQTRKQGRILPEKRQ
jgi:hypothetical protein